MEPLFWMIRGEDRKPVVRDDVRAELESQGWVVEEAEKPARGRPRKEEE